MAKVTRVKEVQAALVKATAKHAKGLEKGLYKAGLFLQRESQELVPIQTGILRASADTRARGSGLKTTVIVSYGTDYALYVHENLDAAHGADFNTKYADEIANAGPNHPFYFNRGPNQQAKFLEKPLREKRHKMASIVRHEMEMVL